MAPGEGEPQQSSRFRHAGFLLSVSTLLDEGDTLQPTVEYVTDWLANNNYDAEVLFQGERPAWSWECPE